MDLLGRFFDALAVNADMTLVDDRLRARPALRQPDEKEEAVDPQ